MSTPPHLALNTKQRLSDMSDSFKSPPPRNNDGMEATPPANPNSNSPYSIIKRKTDSKKGLYSYDYWRLATRHLWRWKRNGTLPFDRDGSIDNQAWARMWHKLNRLPDPGLMNLNVYLLYNGTFEQWMNCHSVYYDTHKALLDCMMNGQAYYRKHWKGIFESIGHKGYTYKRISSAKKKKKTKSIKKRPISPSIKKILVPSSKRRRTDTDPFIDIGLGTHMPTYTEDTDIETTKARRKSMETFEMERIMRENIALERQRVQNIQLLQRQTAQATAQSMALNWYPSMPPQQNMYGRFGHALPAIPRGFNTNNYGFSAPVNGVNGNDTFSNKSGFDGVTDGGLVADQSVNNGQFINYLMSDGNGGLLLDRNTETISKVSESNVSESNVSVTDVLSTQTIDSSAAHPLLEYNEKHSCIPKENAQGKIKREKKAKKEKQKRDIMGSDQRQVSIKQDVLKMMKGMKHFKNLTFKHRSIIGIAIMDVLVESDSELKDFYIADRGTIQKVLVAVAGGKLKQYHVSGFLVDDQVRNIVCETGNDGFLKANVDRFGYFAHNFVTGLIERWKDDKDVQTKTRAEELLKQFKIEMKPHHTKQ